MRTNIVLNDALVKEAARLTGIKTKRELVNEALRQLVLAKRRKRLAELRGRIAFAEGYDYKASRSAP